MIKEIGKELMADPEARPHIIEPLKMQGRRAVRRLRDPDPLKMMTKPGEQFVIRRRAYAMIKKAFDANGIEFAFPTVTVAAARRLPRPRNGRSRCRRPRPRRNKAVGAGALRAPSCLDLGALDQLDLVAVRVFDERDRPTAVLHRAAGRGILTPCAAVRRRLCRRPARRSRCVHTRCRCHSRARPSCG